MNSPAQNACLVTLLKLLVFRKITASGISFEQAATAIYGSISKPNEGSYLEKELRPKLKFLDINKTSKVGKNYHRTFRYTYDIEITLDKWVQFINEFGYQNYKAFEEAFQDDPVVIKYSSYRRRNRQGFREDQRKEITIWALNNSDQMRDKYVADPTHFCYCSSP